MSIRLIWVVFERIRASYVMSIRFVLMPFKDENLIFVSLSPSLDGVIQYCRATSCKKGGTDCISVRCFPTSDPYGLLRMEDGGTVALLAIKEVSTKSIDMRPKFVWVFYFFLQLFRRYPSLAINDEMLGYSISTPKSRTNVIL